ncbi:uncharacterized protein I303_100354 [Kwoniella dejecticola CBS 10117]|uniref:Amidase domain-containing protein n=1 Tax=Kwoniella dejecticola CBS 10117 TaxID=1296121 RepID=A0A1A6AEN9_9TREE|nr:uncharacterized protein I303_00354 [Kwoniella dejecticola CBS 10117]OBR88537.1 hypothetical protein I303_00354 [Kwoniella dejecticola CBS 10117]
MSSTLAPSTLSPNNPITPQAVREILTNNLKVPSTSASLSEKNVEDYTSLLTGIWEIWNRIDTEEEDYVPPVNEDRYPRKNIRKPEGEENKYNAWAWKVDLEDAQKKSGKGLLEGKTICLKDTVAVKGVPCLVGTEAIENWTPNTDATIVTRILEAGGKITGKAVCENLSLWGVSCSANTGPVSNIHAAGFSAGGSSSGTGVLVGRGEVDLGIGGCQGGSIRIPSSVNGIVGMKPTHGLVPYTGVVGMEPILDHVGPMTRTVLDNALFLQAIAGYDGIDDRSTAGCPSPSQIPNYPELAQQGIKGFKIGVITESLNRPLADKRVSELVVKAAEKLKELGAEVVEEVSIPEHTLGPDLWAVIGRLGATKSILGESNGRRCLAMNDLTEKLLPIKGEKVDKLFCSGTNTLINGIWGWENMPPTLMGKTINLIRKMRDAYNTALGKYDVLITPTLPMLATKLPSPDASIRELMENAAGVSLNTSAFNLTGLPALSLPVGFLPSLVDGTTQLPVGMQIISKNYGEVEIYKAAYAWESGIDWKSFA